MTATFQIKITGIRTGTVGQLTDVIRKVDFSVAGADSGQTFELPQTVDLNDPQPESFVQLASLTQAQVVAFVESTFTQMDSVKAHIQFVLNKEVARAALESKPLPWA
jgi:hypothetical protein